MTIVEIIVIGGGGHASVLEDALSRIKNARILGYTDIKIRDRMKSPYLGNDAVIEKYSPADVFLVNGIVGDAQFRHQEIYRNAKQLGYRFYTLKHPSATIAADVELKEGVQVMAGAVIQTGAAISENAIINTMASIDHDCVIGAHVHIAPGATLCGHVSVDETAHIGAGATVIQNVRVGAFAVVGAGAVVISDIPSGMKAWGVPASVRKSIQNEDCHVGWTGDHKIQEGADPSDNGG